jgi:hypothetical protein
MDEKSKRVLLQYTLDTASILKQSIHLMETNAPGFYRVAAVQLRILLCDTTFRHNRMEDIAVLPILFPELKLPGLSLTDEKDQAQWLTLKDWLDQRAFADSKLSVRQMIRRVCDVDGGAHFDPKPLQGVPVEIDQAQWILKIAKIVQPELERALQLQSQ